MMPSVSPGSSASLSPELQPNFFADTVQAVARVIFIVIGSLFSVIAIVAMFVDLAVPSPILLLIGGVAFIALGIFMPKRERPPAPPISDPSPPHALSATIQENQTARIEDVSLAQEESQDLSGCCTRKHVLLENERQVTQIVERNLQEAQKQLKSLTEPYRIHRSRTLGTPAQSTFQRAEVSTEHYTYGTCSMLCKEGHKFTFLVSEDTISFDYRNKSYKASFIASLYGSTTIDTRSSIMYYKEHLSEYLTHSIIEYTPLTQGYYNSLSTLYDHIDLDLARDARSFLNMLVVLFLREHLWIANLGANRVVLFQQDQIVQLSCCKDLPEPALQQSVLVPSPFKPLDATLPPNQSGFSDDSMAFSRTASSDATILLDATQLPNAFQDTCGAKEFYASTPLEPAITRYRINDINGLLVIGSPRFWETLSPDAVSICLKTHASSSLQDIAKSLMELVHANGYSGAATVTVLKVAQGRVKVDNDYDLNSEAGSA